MGEDWDRWSKKGQAFESVTLGHIRGHCGAHARRTGHRWRLNGMSDARTLQWGSLMVRLGALTVILTLLWSGSAIYTSEETAWSKETELRPQFSGPTSPGPSRRKVESQLGR